MDNDLTPEEKKKIYRDLFDITFEQLKSKKLSIKDGQLLAEYVINNMNFINTRKQLLVFLENMSILWDFFTKYFLEFKSQEIKKQEKQKIEELSKKIFSFLN